MRYGFVGVCGLWAWSFLASAQDPPIPVIECEGKATVFAAPTFAEFWMHSVVEKDTIIESMNETITFETRLREALAARSLAPNDIEFRAAAVPDVNHPEVTAAARLRFHMSNFASVETGPQQFAALCDKLADLAEASGFLIEGPFFTMQNPDTLIRSAVAKATEQAYPTAEAVAAALKTGIYAVSAVNVVEVSWDQAEEVRGIQPTLRQVSCTVRVRVVYEVASAP
ncbi:MAG TPA: SIMPL domain-containing protein [Candidatus Hydrogenedentes bacterium]|nr:SIMPL domain-containing protein [Candidatus Hydrogenedentota bacterium]HNT89786.1 SIMPL domain-containing protein [Candidatus Hydrogenedentota bacterium]